MKLGTWGRDSGSWTESANGEVVQAWYDVSTRPSIPAGWRDAAVGIQQSAPTLPKAEHLKDRSLAELGDTKLENMRIGACVEAYDDGKLLKHVIVDGLSGLWDSDKVTLGHLALAFEPADPPFLFYRADGNVASYHLLWPVDWNAVHTQLCNVSVEFPRSNSSVFISRRDGQLTVNVNSSAINRLKSKNILLEIRGMGRVGLSMVLEIDCQLVALLLNYLDGQSAADLTALTKASLSTLVSVFEEPMATYLHLLAEMRFWACPNCGVKAISDQPPERYHCALWPVSRAHFHGQFNYLCPSCQAVVSTARFFPLGAVSDIKQSLLDQSLRGLLGSAK